MAEGYSDLAVSCCYSDEAFTCNSLAMKQSDVIDEKIDEPTIHYLTVRETKYFISEPASEINDKAIIICCQRGLLCNNLQLWAERERE